MADKTMAHVAEELNEIIDYAKRQSWRMGYFAALYVHVAKAFDQAIKNGVFNDPELIERLAVNFFDRFLTAVNEHRHDHPATQSWNIAFVAAQKRRPIVITHLLLGMNAHINFDLGVAVANTVAASDMETFKRDYDRMNHLLETLVGGVEKDLTRIWPWLGWLHHVLGSIEDVIINFSMRMARNQAWRHAQHLVTMPPAQRASKIQEMDQQTHSLGKLILDPGWLINIVTAIMRLEQRGTVPELIDILLSESTTARLNTTTRAVLLEMQVEDQKQAHLDAASTDVASVDAAPGDAVPVDVASVDLVADGAVDNPQPSGGKLNG